MALSRRIALFTTLAVASVACTVASRETPTSSSSALGPRRFPPLPTFGPCIAAPNLPWPIQGKWNALGGPSGPLGCVVEAQRGTSAPSGVQTTFLHGQIVMASAPNVPTVTAVYDQGNAIVINWDSINPITVPPHTALGVQTHDTAGVILATTAFSANDVGRSELSSMHGFMRLEVPVGTLILARVGLIADGGSFTPLTAPASVLYTPYVIPVPVLATTVADTGSGFQARARAAIEYEACGGTPLWSPTVKLDYGFIINAFARLERGGRCPTDPGKNLDIVSAALMRSWPTGLPGTNVHQAGCARDGDYDVVTRGLMPIMYKHGRELAPAVYQHVLHDLLADSTRAKYEYGVYDASVEGFECDFIAVPESENHILQIQTSKYLTNQLLAAESNTVHNGNYDNNANGMTQWLLLYLQTFLQNDFAEYNSRPYQFYSIPAIQNLYEFAWDEPVRTAARMVLDFHAAKFAVASNGLRKVAPFRRKSEHAFATKLDDADNDAEQFRFDVYAGNAQHLQEEDMATPELPLILLKDQAAAHWSGTDMMLYAAAGTYRVPDLILDVAIDKTTPYFQRFFMGTRSYNDIPGGTELYASSPDFLIAAGGMPMQAPYPRKNPLNDDDLGQVLPTVLIPTAHGTDRKDFTRIEGIPWDMSHSVNTCVAPGFACGARPIAAALPDEAKVVSGPWTFVNASDQNYFAAVFSACIAPTGDFGCNNTIVPPFGFFEAVPSANVDFQVWMAGVLARNGKLATTFEAQLPQEYLMTDGRRITFVAANNNNKYQWGIVSIDGQSFEDDIGKWPLAQGEIIQADHSGLITIVNPKTRQRCVLDDRDAMHPKRQCDDIAVQIVTPTPSTATGSISLGAPTTFSATSPDPSAIYAWSSSVEGPMGTGPTVAFKFLTPGARVVTVTAVDGDRRASAQITYTAVDSGPTPSIAAPTASQQIYRNQPFSLIGTATDSVDFAFDCHHLRWSMDLLPSWSPDPCGTTSPAVNLTGPAVITLTATDQYGKSASARVNLSFIDPPSSGPPGVIIVSPPANQVFVTNRGVHLSGQVTDPAGGAVSYRWTVYNTSTGAETTIGSTSQLDWLPSAQFFGFANIELRLYGGSAGGTGEVGEAETVEAPVR